MVSHLVLSKCLILCFSFSLFTLANSRIKNSISVNCGSDSTATSISGTEWVGDFAFPKLVKGSSTVSRIRQDPWDTVDPVSFSQFSYTFQLTPGQKLLRLHFFPNSYNGFHSFSDLFSVEAGPFTLLSNFSASTTAHALNRYTFAKEFCITVQVGQPLTINFSPAADKFHAFINGIEIIPVSSSSPYCHAEDVGVQVVGKKSVLYIDHTTALELVHRQITKWGFHDFQGIENGTTWKVPVDVGFSYLVKLHLIELGIKEFKLFINHIAADIHTLQEKEEKGNPWCRSFMVTMKGQKPQGKRDLLISLQSNDELLVGGHGLIQGFEIFKLSNDVNNLANPNPLQAPPSHTSQTSFPILGGKNKIATVFLTVIFLINIFVYGLQKIWKENVCEEANGISARATRLCRCFSLHEIKSATEDFFDAFVIGKGGFGKVYRGRIDNRQQTVAIKRLKSNSKQGEGEFHAEIETLSELQHCNIVSLIGFCNEQREMILVYEYMCKGTDEI